MSDLTEKDRQNAIKAAVGRSFEGLQQHEMQTPEEAGMFAADFAFARALEKEKARASRKRQRKK